jgi:hypothetical protein
MKSHKKPVTGLAIAAIASTAFVGVTSAEIIGIDTAAGGNGGVSNANSNGGSVSIGSANSGGGHGMTTVINDALVSGEDIAQAVMNAIYGGG